MVAGMAAKSPTAVATSASAMPGATPVSSVQVADSLIKDYCNSLVEATFNVSMPGLFFLPGELTVLEVKSKHRDKLLFANNIQRKWFDKLVKVGDALFASTNGNPIAISDDMRLAARELGIDRSWMSNFRAISLIKCTACGSLRDPDYPICPNCKAVVDSAKAKELKLEFVK